MEEASRMRRPNKDIFSALLKLHVSGDLPAPDFLIALQKREMLTARLAGQAAITPKPELRLVGARKSSRDSQ